MEGHRHEPATSGVGGGSDAQLIRVVLPAHLRVLARVDDEVQVEVVGSVTAHSVLDALEARYPVLQGTIRDYGTLKRRAFLRYFACAEDISHEPSEAPLDPAIAAGREPFMIIGALSGG